VFCSTEDVVLQVVMQTTQKLTGKRNRFWDLIAPQHCGKPSHYVVHSYQGRWEDTVHQVAQALGCTGGANAMNPSQTFVWVDFLAVNMHTQRAPIPVINSTSNPVAEILAIVRDTLAACPGGAVMAVDYPYMTVLDRAWCMYEVWAAVYYGDCTQLTMALPDKMSIPQLIDFQRRSRALDLTRALSFRPEDKARILSEVKHSVGLKRMTSLVMEVLLRGARQVLRWSGNMGHMGLYAGLLLMNGEWYQLQQVLHTVEELADDEKTLQDIRDIFRMYDTDGSNELDEGEFIKVMGVAGFEPEEAREMFGKVDVDNGGTVSLDEFESWWVETQRQYMRKRKIELSTDSLISNLESLVGVMRRNGHMQHAEFFSTYLQHVASGAAPLRRGSPLAAPLLFGSYEDVANQCAWKVNSGAFREASKSMYSLLMWNADALECPPSELPAPSDPKDVKEQTKLLATYMEHFARLLNHQGPPKRKQVEYFEHGAAELRASVQPLDIGRSARDVLAAGAGRRSLNGTKANSKSKKGGLFPSKYVMERESLVNSMIQLKYGSAQLISNNLIVEAELALSKWMASSKNKTLASSSSINNSTSTSTSKPVSGLAAAVAAGAQVQELTRNYLSSMSAGVVLTSSTYVDKVRSVDLQGMEALMGVDPKAMARQSSRDSDSDSDSGKRNKPLPLPKVLRRRPLQRQDKGSGVLELGSMDGGLLRRAHSSVLPEVAQRPNVQGRHSPQDSRSASQVFSTDNSGLSSPLPQIHMKSRSISGHEALRMSMSGLSKSLPG